MTVSYQTADGTATVADSDYAAVAATVLTFNPGQTSKTVTVLVTGDSSVEPNETFTVNLSGASGATIADATGQGTILNDDGAALPLLSINDVSLAEGNSGTTAFTFTVSLSGASASPVTVSYETAEGTASVLTDFTEVTATVLTFAPGQTSKTVTVLVSGDTSAELTETFAVNLSGASGATITDGAGQGSIVNDDGAALPAAPSSLAATALSRSQIGLVWTDNASNEAGFRIERSRDGTSGWLQVATVAANVTSYTYSRQPTLTTYFYRVRATNAVGNSVYSNVASATTLG